MGPFLSHYRSLGVKRFVFIDDNSNDGTREFLFEQSDCMVLGSSYTYCGDYPIANTALKRFQNQRDQKHLVESFAKEILN